MCALASRAACSNQSPSRAPRAATRGGLFSCFAAARAACVSTWLGERAAFPLQCKCKKVKSSHWAAQTLKAYLNNPLLNQHILLSLALRAQLSSKLTDGHLAEPVYLRVRAAQNSNGRLTRAHCPDQGPSRAPRAATEYLAALQPRAQRA